MVELISYDEAVIMSKHIEAYFNSPASDQTILNLSDKFKVDLKDGFVVEVKTFSKNCQDCKGCHSGKCTLGCYKPSADTVCYWDKALEAAIGTKLVTHEMGHVIYEQVFDDKLDVNSQPHYDKSEEFAQYFENYFDIDMSFQPQGVADPVSSPKAALKDTIGTSWKQGLIVYGIMGAIIIGAWFFTRKTSSNRYRTGYF